MTFAANSYGGREGHSRRLKIRRSAVGRPSDRHRSKDSRAGPGAGVSIHENLCVCIMLSIVGERELRLHSDSQDKRRVRRRSAVGPPSEQRRARRPGNEGINT